MQNASRNILFGAAALMALSACDPAVMNSPDNPRRNTQQGALIGAGVGALAGVIAGNDAEERRNNAVIGAAIGAGAGALVGNELDKQEAALRQQMANDDVVIRNTGDRLIVTLPQDILFATDSTSVSPVLQGDLGALANNLLEYPNSTVQVVGHTDNEGDASYNFDLSQRRAQAVAGILISNGVSSGRIQTIGRGEDAPIASNLTPEGRAQNRRVEIVILPTA